MLRIFHKLKSASWEVAKKKEQARIANLWWRFFPMGRLAAREVLAKLGAEEGREIKKVRVGSYLRQGYIENTRRPTFAD